MFDKYRGSTRRRNLYQIERGQEQSANYILSVLMSGIAFVYLLVALGFAVHLFRSPGHIAMLMLTGFAVLILAVQIVCRLRKYSGHWIKYVNILIMLWSMLGINFVTGNKVWMLYAVPVLLTCRYYNYRFTVITGVFAGMTAVATAFVTAYLSPLIGIIDLNMVSVERTNVTLNQFLFNEIMSLNLDPHQLLMNTLRLSTLPNILMLGCVTAVCLSLISNGHRLIADATEKAELETELEKSRMNVMISQIRPHFLYNTLSAIMAIDGNPDETVEAIGEFGKYLRENLDVLTASDQIPFTKEIQHVMRYLSLEQLRFGDMIHVEYDLEAESFMVPTLSVQMLVENSIKHGLTKQVGGGTVAISTRETEKEYTVKVRDDGAGFDASADIDNEKHVGIENIRSRVETFCGGSLEIESMPGRGTAAVIHIPKQQEETK